MNPAPSVIIFSVLSGLGFGYLAFLGFGVVHLSGWLAFGGWAIGYSLATIGLLAATFHLGNPQRAFLAFTQWRSSWLSREAWAAVATLVILAPMALSDWLGLGLPQAIGMLGGVLALVTVFTTSMIYAQIRAVPRWHHWITPPMFVGFALAGGALLAGQTYLALGLLASLGLLLLWAWRVGDGQFARAGSDLATATGLGAIGEVAVFELPHTGGNYLLREMIYVVGRKHGQKLRLIALVFASIIPVVLLALSAAVWVMVLAVLIHLTGAFVARWLFFAQAEHVVGLYYGKRQLI